MRVRWRRRGSAGAQTGRSAVVGVVGKEGEKNVGSPDRNRRATGSTSGPDPGRANRGEAQDQRLLRGIRAQIRAGNNGLTGLYAWEGWDKWQT